MDGSACRRCGRGIHDGVSLHVHHTQYIKGKKPWNTPTICAKRYAAVVMLKSMERSRRSQGGDT